MVSGGNNIKTSMQIEILEEDQTNLREQIRILSEGMRTLTSILITPSERLDGVKRIEQLQSTWRLEDTGFSSLFNACMQMQNTFHITLLEADKDFDELQSLRLEQEKMKHEVCTIQKEKIELQKKNCILLNEVEDHKKYKKVVARSVRNFVCLALPRVRDIVSTAKVEEEKKEIFTLQKGKIELQDYKNDVKEIACSVQNIVDTRNEERNVALVSSIPNLDVPGLQYSTSLSSSEDDWEDISSTSSGLVTDDGCATIRFPKRESLTRKINMYLSSTIRLIKRESRKSKNNIYLSFPSKRVGLQFSSVFTKGYFKDEENLHVCGFMGFDNTLNWRPEFGSRLVSVDGISLRRKQWKMDDFVDYICAKSGPIHMRFCNNSLSTAQIEQLIAI